MRAALGVGGVIVLALVGTARPAAAADHPPDPMAGLNAPVWYVQVARWNAVELWNKTVAASMAQARRRARSPLALRTGAPSTGTVNGYPCGGELPPCSVLACESGGNPAADNPRSSASGLWQILDSTWAGFGGYGRALYAPASVQNAKAALLWNHGAGARQWVCG